MVGVMVCLCFSLSVCVCAWEPQGSHMQCTGFTLFVWCRVYGIHAVRLRDHLCSAQESSGQTTDISAHSFSSLFVLLPSPMPTFPLLSSG